MYSSQLCCWSDAYRGKFRKVFIFLTKPVYLYIGLVVLYHSKLTKFLFDRQSNARFTFKAS